MNIRVLLSRIDWRDFAKSVLVWSGALFLVWFVAGDFDPLQSIEGVSSASALLCPENAPPMGGLLRLIALGIGISSESQAANLLQSWCFGAWATCIWVCYRLMRWGGIDGLWTWGAMLMIAAGMVGSMQQADLGNPLLGSIALSGVCAVFYLEGRFQWFWVLWALLAFHEPQLWGLLLAFVMHQASLPRFQMNFGGLLWSLPLFGGITFGLLLFALFAFGGDVPDWEALSVPLTRRASLDWMDGEWISGLLAILLLIVYLLFRRGLLHLRQSGVLLWGLLSACVGIWAMNTVIGSLLWWKWFAWMAFAGLIGRVLEERHGRLVMGAAALSLVLAYIPSLRGENMSRQALRQTKAYTMELQGIVKENIDPQTLGHFSIMDGLPVMIGTCEAERIPDHLPAAEVLAGIRSSRPDWALLPQYNVFRDGMEGAGYLRKVELWQPVLVGQAQWTLWERADELKSASHDLTCSSVSGVELSCIEGLEFRMLSSTGDLFIELPESGATIFRCGVWMDKSAMESAKVLVITDGVAVQELPMYKVTALGTRPSPMIKAFLMEIDQKGTHRQLHVQNPNKGWLMMINPEWQNIVRNDHSTP